LDPKLITPYLLGLVVAWAIYRRVRRNFGRQIVNARRLQARVAIFSVIGALVLLASVVNIALLGALIAGAACGGALGYFGLRHTRFEVTALGRFYTPHTYIGLFVTALFVSRMAFRFLTVNLNTYAAGQGSRNPFELYQRSPLTLAIFGVLIGYYVVFNIGVLRKSRDLVLPAKQAPTAQTPGS
jgi:hypothetical protein